MLLHAAGKERGRRSLLPFRGHRVRSLLLMTVKMFPDVQKAPSLAPSTDAEITRQVTDYGAHRRGPRGARQPGKHPGVGVGMTVSRLS